MRSQPTFLTRAAGREWVLLGVITLGGLLLRLAAWSSQATFTGDTIAHAALARTLAGGPSNVPLPPPGTALFLLPLQAFLEGPAAFQVLSCAAGLLLIPAVFFLARALGAGMWALLPALAVAALPPFVAASRLPGNANLLAVLIVLALLFARRGWDLTGGAVMGVAFLVGPEALFLALLGAAGLRRPARVGRWLAGFAAVAVPALGVMRVMAGQWGWADPNVPFLGPRWWEPGARGLAAFLPYLALLGVGLAALLSRAPAGGRRRVAGWALVAAVLVLAVVGKTGRAEPGSARDLELAKAGQWLRSRIRPGATVVAPGLLAAYQAGATYAPIPTGTYDEILDAIVREGVDFLVVDSEALTALGSGLAPLSLDKPVAWHETRVRPVYLRIREEDKNTLVFRVVRPGGPPPIPGEENMKGAIGHMNHSEEHFFHGVLAQRSGAYWVAAGEYTFAVLADELNAAAHGNLARCLLLAEQDYARAEEHARSAVALEDTNPEFLAMLAEVLRREGKLEEAVTWEAKGAALGSQPRGEDAP